MQYKNVFRKVAIMMIISSSTFELDAFYNLATAGIVCLASLLIIELYRTL